jgi:transposase
MMISSKESWRQMNRTSEGNKKEREAAEQVTRQSYSGSCGKVSVSILSNVKAESLMNETVKKVRRGSIVYTDKWKGYDSLMFCGYRHLSIDHKYKFKFGKVYINGIEGFWSFAKELLMKHHGISKEKFLYYIKEMEWRYNNREKVLFVDLIHIILKADC